MSSNRDRAMGALVGLAVGDAVGTTLEFKRPGSFTPITDMVGGGPFGLDAGAWTDDTSMAMCLAESIVDRDALDPVDQLRRYVAWRRDGYWSSTGECFDIGITTSTALARFERDGWNEAAEVDEESAANGSLMRLAAVPLRWHADVAEAAEKSGVSSRTTHPATRPVDACRVFGAMIAAFIGGQSADEVNDGSFWDYGPLDPRVEAVARGSWRDKEPPAIRGTGYVVDALEAALWAVAGATDFRDAVLRAANLGDDADTTAAIAGQLAGARWGVSGIPERWRSLLVDGERITGIAARLFDVATGADPPETWDYDETVHGYWIDPGRILAGEYPGDLRGPRVIATKLGLLLDQGVRTFVDLTEPGELDPYEEQLAAIASLRGLHVTRLSHPIPDMGVVHDDAYDAIVEALHGAGDGVVYVHCWGGIGRTATAVGSWLVDQGHNADGALGRINTLRSVTRKAHRPAPQNDEQIDVIRRRRARR